VWDIVSKPEFVRQVRDAGEVLMEGLQRIKAAHPDKVGDLRGKGMLRGFEYTGGEVADLLGSLRARGMLALRSGANVVRIAPPLIINEKEIETGIALIEEALR
jgi:acetylornithine/N-succinyldiaminopimelate aminotransferase